MVGWRDGLWVGTAGGWRDGGWRPSKSNHVPCLHLVKNNAQNQFGWWDPHRSLILSMMAAQDLPLFLDPPQNLQLEGDWEGGEGGSRLRNSTLFLD